MKNQLTICQNQREVAFNPKIEKPITNIDTPEEIENFIKNNLGKRELNLMILDIACASYSSVIFRDIFENKPKIEATFKPSKIFKKMLENEYKSSNKEDADISESMLEFLKI